MKVLVCVKRVPFTGGKMVLNAESTALETRHLGFTISPHEECGVEEAVRLIEAGRGEIVVVPLRSPFLARHVPTPVWPRHEHRNAPEFLDVDRRREGPI